MTSTIRNQKQKSRRDDRPNNGIFDAGTRFLKRIWSQVTKDDRPNNGIFDAGTRSREENLSLAQGVESSQEIDDVETSTQTQQEKYEHPKTSFWQGTNKDGRPGKTDHGGTP